MRCSGAHNAQPMGGKTVHTPQKKNLLFGKKAQQLEDVHQEIHCIPCSCEFNPENSPKSLTSLPNDVSYKNSIRKKNPSKFTYQISHQKWVIANQPPIGTHQLLWTKKLGGFATVGPSKLFGAQHHPDEFGFLAETPMLGGSFRCGVEVVV